MDGSVVCEVVPKWHPVYYWFLGPSRVHNANSISIGSAAFAGLAIMTDR